MTVAYDGRNYAGWQRQRNATTVQSVIEDALRKIDSGPARIFASGRTDAGVHAMGQVVHLDLERDFDPATLLRALNAMLPPEIRIMKTATAESRFDARKHAVSKEYRYFIWNDEVLPPHLHALRTHLPGALDETRMQTAASCLVGRHDFASFTANVNRTTSDTTRLLSRLDVRKRGHELTVIAVGEGFLYKMVRSLAGFLIKVGKGAESPSSAREVLASRQRTARVPTAPPEGLYLWKVGYLP
tara:strand:+ start:1448 stop:2176 length:729 start_codon:yes stop_codon:yes gene_type:complete